MPNWYQEAWKKLSLLSDEEFLSVIKKIEEELPWDEIFFASTQELLEFVLSVKLCTGVVLRKERTIPTQNRLLEGTFEANQKLAYGEWICPFSDKLPYKAKPGTKARG